MLNREGRQVNQRQDSHSSFALFASFAVSLPKTIPTPMRNLLLRSLVSLGIVCSPASFATSAADDLAGLAARVARNESGEVIGIDLSRAWLTDADMQKVAELPALESIDL